MTRFGRIFLELLGPPILGSVYFVIYFIATTAPESSDDLQEIFGFTLLGAGVTSGPLAILYAMIMEACFAGGLDPRSWRTVAISSGLGFTSGLAILLFFSMHGGMFFSIGCLLLGLGLAVGATLGLIIKTCSKATEPKPNISLSTPP